MRKAQKKFIVVFSAIAAGLLVGATVATSVMYSMKNDMDTLLGRGQKHVVSAANLDAHYYDSSTDDITGTDDADLKAKREAKALEIAQAKTQQTAEEGMVLLKNAENALPLTGNARNVTLLGYYGWHNNMSGGEDPATTYGATSLYKGIEEDSDFKVNPNITDETHGVLTTSTTESSGQTYTNTSFSNFDTASLLSAFDEKKSSFAEYGTAIVTIKRNSGEGNDQVTNVATSSYVDKDGNPVTESENDRTGLSLTVQEMKLIDYANKNFERVIVIVNSANTMELGFLDDKDPNMNNGVYTDPYGTGTTMDCSKIVGAIWAGCCGNRGGQALAGILKGSVNPSGHLSDIHARTLRNDPTYNNFGSFSYTNSAELNSYADTTWFVEYEEDIYTGYRYYETAAAEAKKNNYAGFDYDKAVVYPFGYGLSYTNFTREFVGKPTYDADTETYTFKVNVKNNGSVAGKAVAQIYVNVPWQSGQVEKSHVVLGGFAKTSSIAAGGSEEVTVEVKRDYFESYDYKDSKAYVLDAGDYNFYLANDEEGSHSWNSIDALSSSEKEKQCYTENISSKIVFNNQARKSDQKVATNAEDEELNWKFKTWDASATAGDGYIHDFTRSNFTGSFPTAPTGQDLVVTNEYQKKYLAKYVVADDTENVYDEDGNLITEMPTTNSTATSYKLSDMRGVPLSDSKWDEFIQQFTVESLANIYVNGGWGQPGDEANGVPATFDTDSPYGYYDHSGVAENNNRWYCGAPMLAATFNTELAKEVGIAFGEEALAMGINGVYGYGMDQHRSAFGGRNYEYYSEDPVLSGKMGAREAEGAASMGLVVYMKHFVLNEQEAHRQDNGYCSFVNEQAFREVYLRPFEIYMKEAKTEINHWTVEDGKYVKTKSTISAANGIMTSYNRVGGTYAGASYCINRILRNEWNFTGTVLTDAGGEPDTYMTSDLGLRRGQQLCLCNNGAVADGLFDTTSKVAVTWLQQAGKYTLYNIANSNAMEGLAPGDGVYYGISPWQVVLDVVWGVVGAFALAAVVLDVLVAKDVIKLKDKVVKEGEEY